MSEKKTLYHSSLVELSGEDGIEVLLKSDVLPSKFKNGGHFVQMEIGGADRTYKVENENCARALMDMENMRVVLRAYGSRDDAGIEILEVLDGEPDAPPGAEPPQRQAAPPQRGNRPPASQAGKGQVKPPATRQSAPQKPAAPATTAKLPVTTPKQMVTDARARAYRIEQIWLLALERALHARKFALQHFEFELSDTMLQSAVGTIAIQMLRDSWHHQMPADGTLSLVILEALGKANAKKETEAQ